MILKEVDETFTDEELNGIISDVSGNFKYLRQEVVLGFNYTYCKTQKLRRRSVVVHRSIKS